MHESDKDLFESFRTEDPYDAICLMTVFNKLLKSSRSYNLDIAPKLLGSREELVEILIRSGVGRYLEFENVGDIHMYDETLKALEKVIVLFSKQVINTCDRCLDQKKMSSLANQ